MKAEVHKPDINKLVNVPTSLNNLKTKVDDLDVGKLKAVPVDFKKLSGAVDNEVVKNTKFNTLKTKVNNLEKKIPEATTLICINHYNTDKQNLKQKLLMKKWVYSGYGVICDSADLWDFDNDFSRNVVIFGDDNSSSSHTDNRNNNILVLGKGPTCGIN